MANLELRRNLAAAAGAAISEQILDMIHERLIRSEQEKTSMPLTLKYDFSIDEIGELVCTMTAKCNIGLAYKQFKLESDGKQLKLWGAQKAEEKESEKAETVASVPDDPKTPRKVKKSATRKVKKAAKPPTHATKVLKAKVAGPPDKMSNGADAMAAGSTASKRLGIIARENEDLYRDGTITRDQAEAAGVNVDLIDNGTSVPSSASLTKEEMKAIEDLSN